MVTAPSANSDWIRSGENGAGIHPLLGAGPQSGWSRTLSLIPNDGSTPVAMRHSGLLDEVAS
jgi:hypothetical protein